MSIDGVRGELEEVPPPRLSRNANLRDYALALVGALDLAARVGGRAAFDSLFDRGFKRLYAWSYLLAGRNATDAEALTWEILSDAAEALARRGDARSRLRRPGVRSGERREHDRDAE